MIEYNVVSLVGVLMCLFTTFVLYVLYCNEQILPPERYGKKLGRWLSSKLFYNCFFEKEETADFVLEGNQKIYIWKTRDGKVKAIVQEIGEYAYYIGSLEKLKKIWNCIDLYHLDIAEDRLHAIIKSPAKGDFELVATSTSFVSLAKIAHY